MVRNPIVEIRHLSLKVGDKLLLCSDGLTKELTDLEIQDLLNDSLEPQTICDNLLAVALEKGGRDNVTMIVAEVKNARS